MKRTLSILTIFVCITLLFTACKPSNNTTNTKTDDNKDLIQDVTEEQLTEWRNITDNRISEIINTPNVEIPSDVLVYYVSNNGDDSNDGLSQENPWQTYKNLDKIQENSYVLFERGGTWRGQLILKSNVTYSAYGEGPKPNLYASLFNGANPELWEKTETPNVWKIAMGKEQSVPDVGHIICDGRLGSKVVQTTNADGTLINIVTGYPFASPADLKDDLQFFFTVEGKRYTYIYMYSEGNPGERFNSIEFGVTKNIMYAEYLYNVTVDNLNLAYTGAHGFGVGSSSNITVQNCTFNWIGGGLQPGEDFEKNHVRYGNAIEIYGECNGYYVRNNYLYQIYDTGISCQLTPSSKSYYMLDQEFTDNIIEYCNSPFENFLKTTDNINDPTYYSTVENYLIASNITWHVGEGLCHQRPNLGGSNISGASRTRVKNYIIKDNLFIGSDSEILGPVPTLNNIDGSPSLPILINNTFLHSRDNLFGRMTQDWTIEQAYDNTILDSLAKGSYGNKFYAYPNSSNPTEAIEPNFEIIKFGKYEQDGNLKNGKEDIEWYVLERDGDRALIYSKYILDNKVVSVPSYSYKLWEISPVREWLNSEFISNAFTKSESSRILTTNLEMDNNPDYPSDSGNNTSDSVFNLSYSELIKYFPNKETRICYATKYAHENRGAQILSSSYASSYPLRTIGITQNVVIYVNLYGNINTHGSQPTTIRPAMWINISNNY